MKRTLRESDSNSPIFQYFPKVSTLKNLPSSSHEFYSQYLPKKDQQKQSTDTSSIDVEKILLENEELKKENRKLKKDLAGLTKLHNQTCRAYVKKDLKIKLLEKRSSPKELIFEKHKNVLGEATLIALRKIDGNRRSDSTFILKVMRKLYENDLKDVKGPGEIPPDKKEFLKEILTERLVYENIDEIEADDRVNRLNELLKNAIVSMSRSKVRNNLIVFFLSQNFNELTIRYFFSVFQSKMSSLLQFKLKPVPVLR